MSTDSTPAAAGFAMPAEWEPHSGCLMSWPTRGELWGSEIDAAKQEYAEVARAIARFETVLMVCNPGDEQDVRDRCGSAIDLLPFPINDSWVRDNGPVLVRDPAGNLAVVAFRFNAWGERWSPYDDDAALPRRIAGHFGLPVFEAPFVLEGGAYLVDGEGTLITTEQCLLQPNRNPQMSREAIEQGLRDYLGVSTIVWLPYGHPDDTGPHGTDGHLDGVAAYVAPGHVMLEAPGDGVAAGYSGGRANLAALEAADDARGHRLTVSLLDPGPEATAAYANVYLADGAVVVTVAGDSTDTEPLARLADVFQGREIVPVPGRTIAYGGGGAHCITQQIPTGSGL